MQSLALEKFKKQLTHFLKMDIELVVNENRSTMLNLLECNRTSVRLSLHKMFLEAPDRVIAAIAHYIRGGRKEKKERNFILRQYIQEHLSKSDYTHLVKQQTLIQQGEVYQLQIIYDTLNKKYFDESLDVAITWYGKKSFRCTNRVTFGQYLSGLRLIKIHRMLDDPYFPQYFVSFVVYHEMLHNVVPSSTDHRGRLCFHSKAFKEREKMFEHYREAVAWEKKNKECFFKT